MSWRRLSWYSGSSPLN